MPNTLDVLIPCISPKPSKGIAIDPNAAYMLNTANAHLWLHIARATRWHK